MKRRPVLAAGGMLVLGIALARSRNSQRSPSSSATASACRSTRPPTARSTPMSSNVKVYGAIYSAESCSYDPGRGVIVVPNRGVAQNVQTNNAWVSFINHDGSVHTARWIGVQNPGDQRTNLTPPLVLNEPLRQRHRQRHALRRRPRRRHQPDRSERGGHPPLQHADGRAGRRDPRREIDLASTTSRWPTTGRSTRRRPASAARIPTRRRWQVWKITRDGTPSIFVQGAPLRQPNGIAFDPQGNIVVVNIGNNEVLTFSPAGQLLKTENAAQAGQRRPRDHAGRHQVREQRPERRRVAHPSGPARRAHRAEHPERGVDVLRRAGRTSW